MQKALFRPGIFAALFLALASPAQAQNPVATAYSGPTFPGGPDSLRAFVDRGIRAAKPGAKGRMALQFELVNGREPRNFKLATPPEPVQHGLEQAAQTATQYLETHMPAWTPAQPGPDDKPDVAPKIQLVLDFTTSLSARPYSYTEQEPIFPDFVALLRAQKNQYMERLLASPDQRARLTPTFKGLVTYIQMQVKYPPAAMRQHQQGTVKVYFELAENGAFEHVEILGTAGDILDAEVKRVVESLPAATSPGLIRGRPVRLGYVVPLSFKLM